MLLTVSSRVTNSGSDSEMKCSAASLEGDAMRVLAAVLHAVRCCGMRACGSSACSNATAVQHGMNERCDCDEMNSALKRCCSRLSSAVTNDSNTDELVAEVGKLSSSAASCELLLLLVAFLLACSVTL